ncbi:microcompartment protein [Listeria monocytogenes]|nr:microcompartment protein [Listeria monocytogenes]GAT38517.1 microcompartment protein [Listeria monocytogenes]
MQVASAGTSVSSTFSVSTITSGCSGSISSFGQNTVKISSPGRGMTFFAIKLSEAIAVCSPASSAAFTAATSPSTFTVIQPKPFAFSVSTSWILATFAIVSATVIAEASPLISIIPIA